MERSSGSFSLGSQPQKPKQPQTQPQKPPPSPSQVPSGAYIRLHFSKVTFGVYGKLCVFSMREAVTINLCFPLLSVVSFLGWWRQSADVTLDLVSQYLDSFHREQSRVVGGTSGPQHHSVTSSGSSLIISGISVYCGLFITGRLQVSSPCVWSHKPPVLSHSTHTHTHTHTHWNSTYL